MKKNEPKKLRFVKENMRTLTPLNLDQIAGARPFLTTYLSCGGSCYDASCPDATCASCAC